MQTHTFLTLGYHGRIIYPDLKAKLEELQSLDLLYTRTRQRGVYIIPSVVRSDSFDLVLINLKIDETREFIRSGLIDSLSDQERRDLRGVHL